MDFTNHCNINDFLKEVHHEQKKSTPAIPHTHCLDAVSLTLLDSAPSSAAGPTTNPWPSFRHDLLNSGAATEAAIPKQLNKLWMIDREERSWAQALPIQEAPRW